jgi:hypothetical protein
MRSLLLTVLVVLLLQVSAFAAAPGDTIAVFGDPRVRVVMSTISHPGFCKYTSSISTIMGCPRHNSLTMSFYVQGKSPKCCAFEVVGHPVGAPAGLYAVDCDFGERLPPRRQSEGANAGRIRRAPNEDVR